MIDEIDKMGSDFRGDPSSAMLEVLDPAQHSTFRDHYLDLPFDLSKVLFICTANQLEPVSPALRDRMEIIPLAGYTEDEKVGIARRYLIPNQLEAHGLEAKQLVFTEKGLRLIIREYTREAGVRKSRPRDCRDLSEGRAAGGRGQAESVPGSTSGRSGSGWDIGDSSARCASARQIPVSRQAWP